MTQDTDTRLIERAKGHTPGPWAASVERRPQPAAGHWYVVLDPGENGIGEFYGDDHEENAANVHLAALAPELLTRIESLIAALKALSDAEKAYRTSHDLRGDGHTITGRAWDKMRQAGDAARTALGDHQ